MKQIKPILTVMMVLLLAMSLLACSGGDDTAITTTAGTTAAADDAQTTADTQDDGKTAYSVAVVDAEGNPIAGAMVQLCADTCYPGVTDASGVAHFSVLENEYKVSFLSVPEGYAAEAEEFYFEDGATEITLTLTAK